MLLVAVKLLLQQQPITSSAVIYYTQWSRIYRCLSKNAGWAFYSSVYKWDRKTSSAVFAGIYGFLSWKDVIKTEISQLLTQYIVLIWNRPIGNATVDSGLFKSCVDAHAAPTSAYPIKNHLSENPELLKSLFVTFLLLNKLFFS